MFSFPKPSYEQFFHTYPIQTFAVSRDEQQLMYSTNVSGSYEVWRMNLSNGFSQPITSIGQSNFGMTFSKDGQSLITSFDNDGDENAQIYALPANGGELLPLLTGESDRFMIGELTDDGNTLYYTTSKDNSTFLNICSYDLVTGHQNVMIEGKDAAHMFLTASKSGKVAYMKLFANSHSPGFILADGKTIPLANDNEQSHNVSGGQFIGEDTFYYLTNEGSETSELVKIDVTTEKIEKLTDEPHEDFTSMSYDKQKQLLYLVSSSGVEDTLYVYDIQTGTLVQTELPVSIVEKLHIGESGAIYLLGRGATSPFNLYRKRENEKWVPLTEFSIPGIDQKELSEPEMITYRSFDDTEIEALYFKAHRENNNGKLVLWPHGGPQASERKSFRAMFQAMTYAGFSIIAPNFRGSSNYGKRFMKLVEGDWGYGPRLDNVHCLDYMIEEYGYKKGETLLVGGSYGGYMALLLHGRHPEYFKAVVDIFGVSNLFSFYHSVPDFWKPIMKTWIGDPETDKERFTRDSPITYLSSMTKPMLVVQGANDPRVVQEESDQIVEALRAQGSEVDYLVLDDEGHGFSKKKNEIKVTKKINEFLLKFV
ncbi:LOW QUALITY PROTEIN: acylamino-acid-releasing enzyme [Geomicrobium sp. JCM 19039]|nr:LOW QUALITY PROTEIN: acylamino-acid-releasing enzyme [Geomicrobium sp. JCM 19039]